ncbi:Putative methyltransferase [Gloeomargarita lithophora Alchichica-D10]|uniref:Ribosomal RNA small subunit methyltransferase I n=1 Tax=Gloeomargarita lithophora Alchichica-D10 TaxID=1188229 RepID=A0A1J0AC76_9CYAN|nr:16S rRNA (cytidine(1402)-2'-O)-methyltransferase [Gloeomargarita lithophora]APB33519.1 Putative methyltransferase [Gloeomargarita lithophora Alchichica-D10]
MNPAAEGRLYLVATPIGNLEDMTFRAVRVLGEVDVIAAEDTRHTGKLLQYFGITTPQISYHQHNQRQRQGELLTRLHRGEQIALVSDAGIPGISDPGTALVQACIAVNIAVTPIPGANAALTALCAGGLATDAFLFLGFLPPKSPARQRVLSGVATTPATLIFYEAPHRLAASLGDMGQVLGQERRCVVARELTKLHEEFWRGTLGTAQAHFHAQPPKGEITLLVNGAPPPSVVAVESVIPEIQRLFATGLGCREIARQLALTTGLPRRTLYQLALATQPQGS